MLIVDLCLLVRLTSTFYLYLSVAHLYLYSPARVQEFRFLKLIQNVGSVCVCLCPLVPFVVGMDGRTDVTSVT